MYCAAPAQAYAEATRKTDILALQSGEPGPIAQVIAGVDLALWDLCARRANLPLFRLLGGQQARLPVYASGINPDGPLAVVQRKHAEGYRAFKLKIGFSAQQDLDHLVSLRAWLGPQAQQISQHGRRYCLRGPQRRRMTCVNSAPTVCCSSSSLPVCLAKA